METINFNGVEAPKSVLSSILKPGQYIIDTIESTLGRSANKNTPYLRVTFSNETGKVSRDFYITPKTLPTLQYIHEQIVGKPITREFKSSEEVSAYFDAVFNQYNGGKKFSKIGIIVGRKYSGGKEYSFVVDWEFIINDIDGFEEKEYTEEEIASNRALVKNDTYQAEQTSQTGTFISETAPNIPNVPVFAGDDDQDLPF